MDEKNKQLLDQILKYAAERKIQIPADIVLKLSTIYAEDLYSELKQGQAPSETEGKILMGTLRKLVEQIVLEEIPEFGLMNPGFVPAPGRAGLMLMSTGWKPYLMPSAPGGGGGGTGISDAPGDSQSYVRYNRTWIVMPPGVTQHSLLTGLDYASAGHTGFQPTLTFPLSPTLGGTGIANLAASTLTLGAATSITGGGTLDLGGFTGTVPATATFAMGAGTLTSATINDVTGAAHTHAITESPLLVGDGSAAYQVLTTGEPPPGYTPQWSGYYLQGSAGGTTNFAVTNTKTLRFIATDDRNITFPITGTAAIGAGTLTSATTNDVTVNAHTHAITASTALVAAGTAQYQVLTTGANPYPAGWSGFYLDGTTGGKTILAVTNTKTLTLTAADSYNLTIPATGTAALGTGTANRVGYWSGTNTLAGSANFTFDGSEGFVGIGVAYETKSALYARRMIQGAAANGQFYGIHSYVLHDNTNVVNDAYGLYNQLTIQGAGAATNAVANFCDVRTQGSSKSTNVVTALKTSTIATVTTSQTRGLWVQAWGCGVAGQTVSWNRAIYIESPYCAGTVSSNWAIYLENVSGGGTDNYAIYTNAGLNRLGDQLSIVASADRQQLIVTGFTTQAVATPMAQITRNDAAAGISAMLGLTALGSGANNDGGSILLNGKTSTTAATAMGLDQWLWVNATHASRTARRVFNVYDTAIREGLRIEASGTAPMIGFLGAAAVAQQLATIDLGTVLSNYGLRVAGTAYPITTSGAVSFTGGVTTSGGRVEGVTTYTDTCNILTTDECVIFNKATAFTATMPAATVGQRFYFKNIGAGNVTLSFPGTDTVDEVDDDLIMTQYDSYTLICRLANKWVKV